MLDHKAPRKPFCMDDLKSYQPRQGGVRMADGNGVAFTFQTTPVPPQAAARRYFNGFRLPVA